jgi:hypothetical protein
MLSGRENRPQAKILYRPQAAEPHGRIVWFCDMKIGAEAVQHIQEYSGLEYQDGLTAAASMTFPGGYDKNIKIPETTSAA